MRRLTSPLVYWEGDDDATSVETLKTEETPLAVVAPASEEEPGEPAGGDEGGRRRHARHRTPAAGRSLARRSLPWAVLLAAAAVAALLLRTYVFQSFYVPSASMEPTLYPGDRMIVVKIGLGTIHRGEVVVFRRPPGDKEDPGDEDLVKRVIGLPGQTIWSKGRTIYINGKPIAQPWLPKGEPPGAAIPRLKIPRNDYFVMGDNRPISYDSRFWHPHFVPRSYIIGEVVLVIWRHGHPYFKII